MSRVLIIIPAYNEADTIADVIAALHQNTPGYDLLVIDDGSQDETAAIVENTGMAELIRMPMNLGIGAAMQTGYKYALRNGYDFAIQCDADGQHPAEQVVNLVARLENGAADLVIGSRYVADTGYVPSLGRRIGKSLLSRLVNAMIGGGITDTTSGFRAANRPVIALFARYYPDDYPETESLIVVHRAGLKTVETPVQMHQRQGGRTSIRPSHAAYYIVKVALAVFISMFRSFPRAHGE